MPALGIVAAVLGVIHTMGSITEPPEVLGKLIGGALVGTFMGVLLSYGFVGPIASALKNLYDSETKYYTCIKVGLLAYLNGYAPAVAVEFAARRCSQPFARPSMRSKSESEPCRRSPADRTRARMAAGDPIIIIKKVKKSHGDAHHGGAWKVAYADFVTAMMAFFLLLWLLNATTQEQRKGISDYFAPASVSRNTSGSGALLGGTTVTKDGALNARGQPVQLPLPSSEDLVLEPSDDDMDAMRRMPEVDGPNDQAPEQAADANNGKLPGQEGAETSNKGFAEDGAKEPRPLSDQEIEKAVRDREEKLFTAAEQELRQAINTSPDLKKLAENLLIDQTPEGLRIQIVDQDQRSMFELGSATPNPQTKRLLAEVAHVVSKLPNRIAVSGHTDATPYAVSSTYTNWELSTDRAQASRRVLVESGLPPERIQRVMGKADREPLVPNDPTSARNRRISIVLLREAVTPAVPAAP
jgi:chemotaxis protein MotB